MHDLESMLERYSNGKRPEFLFFWGHRPSTNGTITKSCLSQWWECSFEVDGIRYTSCEQYMMAEKARVFKDEEVFNRILRETSPKNIKALGRKVKNFNSDVWDKVKFDIVVKGNYAKFSQNKELFEFLMHTGDKILVEASPYDTVWGIGLRESDMNSKYPHKWRGQNLLGFALTEVKDRLRKQYQR